MLFPIIPPAGAASPASFAFDGTDDALVLTWASTGTSSDRQIWTLSFWAKYPSVGGDVTDYDPGMQAITSDDATFDAITVIAGSIDDKKIQYNYTGTGSEESDPVTLTADHWDHWIVAVDTTQATSDDRVKFYLNGALLTDSGFFPIDQNTLTQFFISGSRFDFGAFTDTGAYTEFDAAFLEMVSGQQLAASDFGFDDGGTWTRKPFAGSFGSFGFSLDGSDGFNDVSGNGFDFTDNGGVTLDPLDLPPFTN